jgi:hypothetical protein
MLSHPGSDEKQRVCKTILCLGTTRWQGLVGCYLEIHVPEGVLGAEDVAEYGVAACGPGRINANTVATLSQMAMRSPRERCV